MRTIWKFPLSANNFFTIDMPVGAKILHLEIQGRTSCLWAIVDDEQPTELRRFAWYGTGWGVDTAADESNYIGSVLHHSGALVFHLFDVTKASP